MALFAATLAALRGPDGLKDRGERSRIIGWLVMVVLAFAGNLLVPIVPIRDAMVHTVVFVKVLDTVIPLWIVVRALMVIWSGPARVIALSSLVPALAFAGWFFVVAMPGKRFQGSMPALTADERSVQNQLERDVRRLATTIGERNHHFPARLEAAAVFIDSTLTAAGYTVTSLPFTADSQRFRNLEATLPGTDTAAGIVIIGAHYDAAEGAPGADDNASGTAAMLALARAFHGRHPARTVRFVAFANEEPPFFAGPHMGSHEYAKLAKARGDRVRAMLSLETVGYFTDEAGSQRYPPPFNLAYPDRGNFIGFVGNLDSRPLVRRAIAAFRGAAVLPSEGAAAPALVPGISWSDHMSFWLEGWQAIMITDTAPFRNPHYHMRTDTADRLDYARMARVVTGLEAVVTDLAGP